MNEILEKLNVPEAKDRLKALEEIIRSEKKAPEVLPQFANNHIHSFYSFSPYSPASAVYFARLAGLQTAGIMDHDTIAGASEFIKAAEIAGIDSTIGLECRVRTEGTGLYGRRINNPDQKSIAYMALHGVPHTQIEYLQSVFEPLREKRNIRNRKMVDNINRIMSPISASLDFDRDILPISKYNEGGTVTERHLLFALATKITETAGRDGVSEFLQKRMDIPLSQKQKKLLESGDNPFFDYDLLGILKSSLVERIYVEAHEECMHITDLSRLAKETGSLFCYAYLGDVGESVTGDKRAQKFEDDYLPVLFDTLEEQGIDAVTYMPSRNTPEQLERIQQMCRERNIMEISGEDINSPRQKFICPQLEQPQFSHLIKATWELIMRERTETLRQERKIF
jgi:hypothetical protein